MSVINKVLRDLDQRQAAASGQGNNRLAAGDQVMRGTRALAAAHRTSPRFVWVVVLAVVGLMLAGLTIWWVLVGRGVPMPGQVGAQVASPAGVPVPAPVAAPATASVAAPAAAAAATAPIPTASASVPASIEALAVTASPAKRLTGVVRESVKPADLTTTAAPAPAPRKTPAVVNTSTPVPGAPAIPALAQAPSANSTPSSTTQAMPVPSQTVVPGKPASDGLQPGVNQALAQAQAMWQEGSRASAIDLLRQVLSRVEAAGQDGSNAAGSAPVAAVARELARMEMAKGQVSSALKLLVRLEPKIALVADLWAMRANAAQRLGQHAEATGSYQRALSLKADEPRWLLGLAVSLAAQGQTGQAAELAEKVRLMGALRPEIANYLRQLGVVIRTD